MTIDTNIIIAYLAGEEAVVSFLSAWRMRGGFLFLPSIVEAELLSFPKWNDAERQKAESFLEDNFIEVAFDREISRMAAEVRRKSGIRLPDAIIAASALSTKTPLITRNQKDFKRVNGLEVIVP